MGYVLDAGVILVIGLCLYLGYKRGFVRGVIGLVGTLAALLVAGWLCGPAAEAAFDLFFAKPARTGIEEQLNGKLPDTVTRDEAAEMLDGYLADMKPEGARELLNKCGFTDGQAVVNKLPDEAFATKTALAEEITVRVVRPATLPVIGGVCFLLLFLLLIIVVQIVARVVNKVFELPVLRTFNHAGGLLVGALHGVLWVLALVTLVQLYATFYAGSWVTQEDLRQSALAGWVADHNPVAGMIQAAAEKLGNG